jgi:hypothetical protein
MSSEAKAGAIILSRQLLEDFALHLSASLLREKSTRLAHRNARRQVSFVRNQRPVPPRGSSLEVLEVVGGGVCGEPPGELIGNVAKSS